MARMTVNIQDKLDIAACTEWVGGAATTVFCEIKQIMSQMNQGEFSPYTTALPGEFGRIKEDINASLSGLQMRCQTGYDSE